MKKLSLFMTLLLASSALDARDNPFEPTQAYQEEMARMMEMDENYPEEFQKQEEIYIKSIQDKMKQEEAMNKDMSKKEMKKPMKKAEPITEDKIKKLLKQVQKNTVKETKKIVDEALKKEQEEIIYVKPRTDVSYEKEVLPFVKIEYTNEKFMIHSKYKVFKKFTLPNKNKIILDFYANENFYTKREKLNSTNFTKITVGNHKKDKFFRVVLELADAPENYEVTYDDSEVTIYKLEQM